MIWSYEDILKSKCIRMHSKFSELKSEKTVIILIPNYY